MQDLGRLEYAADLAPLPDGTPVTECPDPSCAVRASGAARIAHHPDGMHTIEWSGKARAFVEAVDGVDVLLTVTGPVVQ